MHWCDNCCDDIDPGQCYEGSVYVTDRGNLMVLKNHVDPHCDPPEEPEDEERLFETDDVFQRAA